jgi:hypothetical protein
MRPAAQYIPAAIVCGRNVRPISRHIEIVSTIGERRRSKQKKKKKCEKKLSLLLDNPISLSTACHTVAHNELKQHVPIVLDANSTHVVSGEATSSNKTLFRAADEMFLFSVSVCLSQWWSVYWRARRWLLYWREKRLQQVTLLSLVNDQTARQVQRKDLLILLAHTQHTATRRVDIPYTCRDKSDTIIGLGQNKCSTLTDEASCSAWGRTNYGCYWGVATEAPTPAPTRTSYFVILSFDVTSYVACSCADSATADAGTDAAAARSSGVQRQHWRLHMPSSLSTGLLGCGEQLHDVPAVVLWRGVRPRVPVLALVAAHRLVLGGHRRHWRVSVPQRLGRSALQRLHQSAVHAGADRCRRQAELVRLSRRMSVLCTSSRVCACV